MILDMGYRLRRCAEAEKTKICYNKNIGINWQMIMLRKEPGLDPGKLQALKQKVAETSGNCRRQREGRAEPRYRHSCRCSVAHQKAYKCK